jgi:hypothetical protein
MEPAPNPRAPQNGVATAIAVVVAQHARAQLAESRPLALVPTRDGSLPRQAFDLVVSTTELDGSDDTLAELVSVRNSLTRDGALLLVVRAERHAESVALAAAAGFTRVREVGAAGTHLITLELKR